MKKDSTLDIPSHKHPILKRLLHLMPRTVVAIVGVAVCGTAVWGLAGYPTLSTKPSDPVTTAPKVLPIAPVVPVQKKPYPAATQPAPQPVSSAPAATYSAAPKVAYRPSVCKNVPIPKGTDYEKDDSMAAGTTSLVSTGQDGYVISCTPGSDGYIDATNGLRVDPVNDLVKQGTGVDAQLQEEANTALAARDQRYNLNLVQCIQSLQEQGVPSTEAESMCKASVQY